jgi:D-alanine-D-alanine ligase
MSGHSIDTKLIREFAGIFPGLPVKHNARWADLTTLGIGETAPLVLEPPDDIALARILEFCAARGIRVMPVGAGSNLLGSDKSGRMVAIRLRQNDFVKVRPGREHLTAGAGARLADMLITAAGAGLGGASALSGIPGTLGGAVLMNAGAHGVSISAFVLEICGFTAEGKPWSATHDELSWGYRSAGVPPGVTVTAAILKMNRVEPEKELDLIHNELKRRGAMKTGRSAGCVFKNISEDDPAGKLIEISGCKGMSVGGAKVSEAHANYLVNSGGATEKDFLGLAVKVKERVLRRTGFYLEPELHCADPDSAEKLLSTPPRMKIAVLKGGVSSEREVSLISGGAVASALRKAGCEVTEIDVKQAKITKAMRDADAVFPVLHGGFGEDGGIQRLFESEKLRFAGCGSRACADSMDKFTSKKIMESAGIKTPGWAEIKKKKSPPPAKLSFPLILKPPREGSTVGINIAHTPEEWDSALEQTFKHDKTVLVEEFIKGVEITVGVALGKALQPIELRYPGEIYDYDAKYVHSKGKTEYLCPVVSLSAKQVKEAQKLALAFFKAVGGRDMMRIDMIVSKKGIYVLEANVLPGFTPDSLLPKAAKAAGYSFQRLCASLAAAAVFRK